MLSLLLVFALGFAGTASPGESDHRRRPPAIEAGEVPQAPSGLFRPWLKYPTGSWPEAVGIGDLSGDGRRDVAVLTSSYGDPENDYKVHVFLQTSVGALAPAVKYPVPNGYNRSLDVGDVTGDGRDDVVVGSASAIHVLRQNATGTLDAPASYATANSRVITIGDFNHDGRRDVAGIDLGTTPDVAVYLQNASGTLEPPVIYQVPHGGRDDLEAGDVNNDGRDDIVLMSGQGFGDNLGILLQLPTGGFAGPFFYDVGGNVLTQGAEVADVNGDGRNDVVVTYGGNPPAYVGVFPQNALGTLDPPFGVGSGDSPQSVESADLDGNGRADLVVVHPYWVGVGVYLQDASGVLATETLEPAGFASHYEPQGLAVGDVSGDGRPDILMVDPNSGLIALYHKTPFDLGLSMTGPPSAGTGSNVAYELRITNHGLNASTGAVVTDTPSGGLQYVSSAPSGACVPAGGSITCAVPSLAPGEQAVITLTMAGIAGGSHVNQATVAVPQGDGFPADNSAAVTTQFLGSCQERVQDGSFELGPATPWGQSSTNFGTPLCTFGSCGNGGGTAGPHTGTWWAWFGGFDAFEQGVLTQNVTLPIGTARLRFQLWIGARSGNGSDFLRAQIDGTQVFVVSESTPAYGSYALVDVDVSAYANGASHQLRLEGVTFGPGITNFSVDQVSIEWCPFPGLAIGDVPGATEGNAGTTDAVFTLSLSDASTQPVTVSWATGPPGTGVPATPGADYAAVSGTVTFAPGALGRTVGIPVLGDLLDEFDERFAVTLSAASGATITDAVGDATILDDDPLPSVSISDATLVEGASGVTTGQLTVSLTPVSGRAVSGTFATADVTAVAGTDYTATTGGFSVPAGAPSTVAAVPVLGDTLDEQDETFTVTLSAPDFAVLGDAQAVATIDDDDGPSLTIADATVTEGDAGTSPASFALSLSAPSVQTVTLDYATASGTATAGSDFTATSGSVTFAPGQTSANVSVPVVGDVLDEPTEFFGVVLSNAVDALPADAQALGVIVDDDGGTFPLAGELSHGVEQWRSLSGAGPRDLFVLARPAFSSFEVQVDAASGDLGVGDGPILRRLAPDLSTVVQTSSPAGTGPARVLTVVNEQASPEADYIEVASAGCSTDCGPDDRYRIVVRETTLTAPRFNNSGGQVTVFVLQNRGDRTVEGTLRFWSSGAALLAELAVRIGPLQTLALNSAGIAALAGRSGSVTATHDGPYGALVGKAVALEPASGFAFDTPFDVRRR